VESLAAGLTLWSYYAGLIAAPLPGVSPSVTGLSAQTLSNNWGPKYTDGVSFSDIVSVLFPCFTGILSGWGIASTFANEHVCTFVYACSTNQSPHR